ncbi:hypothetical protein PHSY_005101 [Pseudozyma hubeiensis SY62]|uniref:Autophagy-related protein 14 n=1 Tax=Pseudozyma hubeiensis (strain SY62) TaxID=1305764 RepID=R9PHD8_PSEHS|nr:hypothetical protein PHSY_005101 [Pseudozyma hubeiensis SY62]GAC97515.1 hypothetical protein PHSY_005101 [Pseudozyma hubeiensis SY62]
MAEPATFSHQSWADEEVAPHAIHYEQRRIGHICAVLVRNLSLRPTRDRALQTLTSQRPGGSNRYHTTSDDADLTLSIGRSNSKGKGKADASQRRRRSASWSRLSVDGSSDEDEPEEVDQLDASLASTSRPTKSQINSSQRNARGRSALINHRRTSDQELTTSSSFGSTSEGAHSVDVSPRPILKRASSTRSGRDARMHGGSPASADNSGFLDELDAKTTMLSRSDSRSSSHSSHTIRRPSHRARTTSMTSSASVRSVRFDESQLGGDGEARRPSRISGRLSAASRYALFSQKSLDQIMKDRMLECCVELSVVSDKGDGPGNAESKGKDEKKSANPGIERTFYKTTSSKPGLHHSWGYQGGDPITPERDFLEGYGASAVDSPLEASDVSIKVWARSPPADKGGSQQSAARTDGSNWKLVCQTSADLRDLEPLPGNAPDASLSLPPNSILLGLAPGANSLSGRASIVTFDSQRATTTKVSDQGREDPKLNRSVSEREAERTRHVLESVVYYAVPIKPARQDRSADATATRANSADASERRAQRGASSSRSPKLHRRTSLEGYASDPENAPSGTTNAATAPERIAAVADSASRVSHALVVTSDARRRERRKAFEDEQRRALELSLRETKMMPSYTLDDAKHLAKKQAEARDMLAEVEELRQVGGSSLQDPAGLVQLRLKREQQKARYEAVRQMAIDESGQLERKRAELATRRSALEARHRAMRASKSLFESAEATSRQLQDEVQAFKDEKAHVALQLHIQQASLLRDLEAIFPIELSDASSLLFSICGLPLPNAVPSLPPTELAHEEKRWKDTVKRHVPASARPVFHPFDDDTVSSALGLVAQLVVLLSTYLATPVHYPLATAGSRAVVQDGISLMSGPRAFPLYAKGMERYRYEYAAFLLNKDIEQLMNVHSVTVIDIRHTLPNLKNLMVTVAAAPPASQLTRKSHIGKTEIALRSTAVSSLRDVDGDAAEEGVRNGKKVGMGIGLGLPNLAAASGKKEVAKDTLVTTRVLGAPSAASATPATASGAIASVSRALSYFSGGGSARS